MKAWELKQALRDKAMRRVLLEFLQKETKQVHTRPAPDWPEPMLDDEEVEEELHRILKVRKGWFR